MSERSLDDRVAVVAVGAVTPAGNTARETRNNLITSNRAFVSTIDIGTGNYRSTQLAGIVTDDFDIGSYVGGKQLKRSDRFARFATAASLQAALNSGLLRMITAPSKTQPAVYELQGLNPSRVGVYMGIAVGGSRAIEQAKQDMMIGGKDGIGGINEVDLRTISYLNPAKAATDPALLIGALGGAETFNAACASGTRAIQRLYEDIKRGTLDAGFAGGVEAPLHPVAFYGFKQMGVLAAYEDYKDNPELATSSLNADYHGLVMGEGAGVLALERYSHAVERGAFILAELAGAAFFTDPRDVLDPTSKNVSRVLSQALDCAEISSSLIDVHNTHSGGTKGDGDEVDGLKIVYGDHSEEVDVYGPKSRFGHLMGGAGGAETVDLIYVLAENMVTPTANLTKPVRPYFSYPTQAKPKYIRAGAKTALGLDGQYNCLVFTQADPRYQPKIAS